MKDFIKIVNKYINSTILSFYKGEKIMTFEGQNQTNQGEREFEVGKDEAWFANIKRTYDEYQQESLEGIKNNRILIDKLLSDAQQYDNQRQTIANQSLQNAVETANMISKQAVRHSDIAIDRQWNVDEQGYTAEAILRNPVFKDAIAAAVVDAVTNALSGIKK